MAGPERLYLEDAYRRACDATVVARHEGCVALDRTVLYAHRHDYGHPQVSDKGLIRSEGQTLRVKRVDDEGDALFHYLEGRPLPPCGATVRCEVDFPRRLVVMRLHAATHALLAVAEDLGLRVKPIASRSPEVDVFSAYVYFEPDGLPRERAADLEAAVNRALQRPREVVVRWRPREEVLARRPAVVLDMGDMADTDQVTETHKRSVVELWKRVLPESRAYAIASDVFVVPGPRVAEAARELGRLLHPEAAWLTAVFEVAGRVAGAARELGRLLHPEAAW